MLSEERGRVDSLFRYAAVTGSLEGGVGRGDGESKYGIRSSYKGSAIAKRLVGGSSMLFLNAAGIIYELRLMLLDETDHVRLSNQVTPTSLLN